MLGYLKARLPLRVRNALAYLSYTLARIDPRTRLTALLLACVVTMYMFFVLAPASADKPLPQLNLDDFTPDPVPLPPTEVEVEVEVEVVPPWARVPLVNATLVMLARNSDAEGAARSVQRLEARFNRRRRYSWTFLNDDEFDEEFKRKISEVTTSPVTFGRVPQEHWVQPKWIDEEVATENRLTMDSIGGVPYASSVPYRNMCRYNSGFFFHHPLLQQYKYYWRVEPDVDFMCDINFDPFLYMQNNNKTYGWTISLIEWDVTIPTLWETTQDFMRHFPEHLHQDNALSFISDDGETYNLCHFWSNFEIADMDFWRSKAYQDYFDFLDRAGGFYYERWGDAPVHTLGAALLLPKSAFHQFDLIGYEHNPLTFCPAEPHASENQCSCQPERSFEHSSDAWWSGSCVPKYKKAIGAAS